MQTDLTKILTVSGQHGLFRYVAQARAGAIAESLADNRRVIFPATTRISTLADIAIFTSEGEMKLDKVFLAMKDAAGDAAVPSGKVSDDEVKAFFAKAVPGYDADRFYLSHMRKILEWYSEIAQYASFDFVTEEDAQTEEDEKPKED